MAGHGGDGFMKFQDQEELTSSQLADALATMRAQASAPPDLKSCDPNPTPNPNPSPNPHPSRSLMKTLTYPHPIYP